LKGSSLSCSAKPSTDNQPKPGSQRRGNQAPPHNQSALRRFLLKPGVRVLYADEQATHQYSAVYRKLRKQGTPIPANDMWIAALVLQHSLVLCARDTHFDTLPQLTRV
jgi:predicted nucleic acid-binding protein